MTEFSVREYNIAPPRSHSIDFSIRDISSLTGRPRLEFQEVSQFGDRFTILSSYTDKSSSYFGPRISERLKELPLISSADLMERKIMDVYSRMDQEDKDETIGSFGITYTSPEGDTLNTTANCGGSLFFYDEYHHNVIDLTDKQSTPLGRHNNPNYLNATTIIIHSGDLILTIPIYLGFRQRERIRNNLMLNIDKMPNAPADYITQKSADYIAKFGLIKDHNISLLALSAISTRSPTDRRVRDQKFLISPLKEFTQASNINEVLHIIYLMRGIQGLERFYSYKDIRKLISHNQLENIPRACGLREAVIRLNKSTKDVDNFPKNQTIVLPQEIT